MSVSHRPRIVSTLFRLALALIILLVSSGFTHAAPLRQEIAPLDAHTVAPVTPVNPVVGDSGPDGPVYASAIHGRTLYIGGRFTSFCQPMGLFQVYDPVTGDKQAGWPVISGGGNTINDIIPDGAGGWYVGGDFTTAGGEPHLNLVHILSNRLVDAAWAPSTNAAVNTLFKFENVLYVGGTFTYVSGQLRPFVAALDATTGALNTAWTPLVDGPINDITANADSVFIGGTFTHLGGESQKHLGAVNPVNGGTLTWSGAPDQPVLDLVLSGDRLFALGFFGQVISTTHGITDTKVVTLTHVNVAAFDVNTGNVNAWAPALDGVVYTLAADGDMLFVGGNVRNAEGQTRFGVAAYRISEIESIATKGLIDWAPFIQSSVMQVMAAGGNTLYMGTYGNMMVNGQSRGPIGAVNSITGGSVPFYTSGSGAINALAYTESALAVGFTGNLMQNCVARRGLAAIDLDTGELLDWNPSVSSGGREVYALAVDGDMLYVGGNFGSVNNQPRPCLAAFDLSTWGLTSWNPACGSAGSNSVKAIEFNGPDVLVGGAFSTLGGKSHTNLAAVSKADGSVDAWAPSLNAEVDSLAVYNDTIYTGGGFSLANPGGVRSGLAAFQSGVITPTAWAPLLNDKAAALEVAGDALYTGGQFTGVTTALTTTARNRLAAFDLTDGTLEDWNPTADGTVNALASGAGKILAGGDFGTIGGQAFKNLAAMDRLTGAPDSNWHPSFETSVNVGNLSVRTLSASGNLVCAGGEFSSVGGQPRSNIACLDLLAARTRSAGTVTHHSVTLNGDVTAFFNTGGQPFFQWGSESGVYTATVPVPATPNTVDVTSTVSVSALLPNLLPQHTYYYRLVVSDTYGTAYGPEIPFMTNPAIFMPAVPNNQ